ncbi:MAG: ATP-binding protein [Victivallaceae bacterium]|nr:ATP-binding protein [Victivallaceae bacterium]
MNQGIALLLIFLETTFVFVGLCLLHNQRKVIGAAAFYLAMGMVFLFAQFISATGLSLNFFDVLSFPVAPPTLFLPYLAALLLVYRTEGVLAAQRLIIGSLVLFGLFLYLAELTRLETSYLSFTVTDGFQTGGVDSVLKRAREVMLTMVSAHLADLFLLPMVFTKLRNLGSRSFFCVLAALVTTQIVDTFVSLVLLHGGEPGRFGLVSEAFLLRMATAFWLALLLDIYLRKIEKENLVPRDSRPLEIVFAFFGGYGRSKHLEKDLRDWEGRYRKIMENASETILLLDEEGAIVDRNRAGEEMLRDFPSDALFFEHLYTEGKVPFHPNRETLAERRTLYLYSPGSHEPRALSISISPITLGRRHLWLMLGRDITEELASAAEQQHLREELAHAQRIESLGNLAGGIAHDFNNHIHAILGHVDLILMKNDFSEDPAVEQHLNKIAAIAEESGKLTSQLLGFARKGKFQNELVEISDLLESSVNLTVPQSREALKLDVRLPKEKYYVRGDRVQLQQALVNLMINAFDATSGTGQSPAVWVAGGDAQSSPSRAKPPPEFHDRELSHFIYLTVADNGKGMDAKTMKQIFEPFFTTKKIGEGTGMGLAMVYGTVANHRGWIQTASAPGKGSVFTIYLPKAEEDAKE